ncbi:MAG: hypothetical protein ACTSX4_09435 [Candidatus Helarchaeota archaeon]
MSSLLNFPSKENVFNWWFEHAQDKKLKKYFGIKGAQFQRNDVTMGQHVKDIKEGVAFFFRSKKESKISTGTGKTKTIEVSEKKFLKTKFYIFSHPAIDPAFWKGPSEVPSYETIRQVPCKDCSSGAIKCKSCGGSGHSECSKCRGKGTLKCKRCGGSGKIENKLEIIDRGATSQEKKKESYTTICPVCHGTGTATCHSCNGFGKTTCKKCKGLGSASCKSCGGSGFFYQYQIVPVPFGKSSARPDLDAHLFYHPEIEKKLSKNLTELFNSADGYNVDDIKELNERFVKQNLGLFNSEIDKNLKRCKQFFEKIEKKDASRSPLFPILVLPVIHLEVETPNNKKFSIIGFGTSNKFTVYSPDFK